MLSRTSFLGRLIGLFLVFFAFSMFLHKQATLDAITAVLGSPATMLTLGVILLFAGLAMVLAHNIWSGGALTIIVTVIGWLTLLKALFLLYLPQQTLADLYLRRLNYQQNLYIYAAVMLCLGAYITFSAFQPKPRS